MKSLRLAKIAQLVEQNDVYTQEHLLQLLNAEGFNVTQATVSRDIKELNLAKMITEDGKYKYNRCSQKGKYGFGKKISLRFF